MEADYLIMDETTHPSTLYRVQHENSLAKFNSNRGFYYPLPPNKFGNLCRGTDADPAPSGMFVNVAEMRQSLNCYCQMTKGSEWRPVYLIAFYKEYYQAMNYALYLREAGMKSINICHVDTTGLGLFSMNPGPSNNAIQVRELINGKPYFFSVQNACRILEIPENSMSRHSYMCCSEVPAAHLYRMDILSFGDEDDLHIVSDFRNNRTRYGDAKGVHAPIGLPPIRSDVIVRTLNAKVIFNGVDETLSGPSPIGSQADMRRMNYRRVFHVDWENLPSQWTAQRATLRLDGYPVGGLLIDNREFISRVRELWRQENHPEREINNPLDTLQNPNNILAREWPDSNSH